MKTFKELSKVMTGNQDTEKAWFRGVESFAEYLDREGYQVIKKGEKYSILIDPSTKDGKAWAKIWDEVIKLKDDIETLKQESLKNTTINYYVSKL